MASDGRNEERRESMLGAMVNFAAFAVWEGMKFPFEVLRQRQVRDCETLYSDQKLPQSFTISRGNGSYFFRLGKDKYLIRHTTQGLPLLKGQLVAERSSAESSQGVDYFYIPESKMNQQKRQKVLSLMIPALIEDGSLILGDTDYR